MFVKAKVRYCIHFSGSFDFKKKQKTKDDFVYDNKFKTIQRRLTQMPMDAHVCAHLTLQLWAMSNSLS